MILHEISISKISFLEGWCVVNQETQKNPRINLTQQRRRRFKKKMEVQDKEEMYKQMEELIKQCLDRGVYGIQYRSMFNVEFLIPWLQAKGFSVHVFPEGNVINISMRNVPSITQF
jgi:hypothetical protein